MDTLQGASGALSSGYSNMQATSMPKKSSDMALSFARLETAVTVTKKANNIVKQQGKAILDLIDSATAVSNSAGANAGGNSASNKTSGLNILA